MLESKAVRLTLMVTTQKTIRGLERNRARANEKARMSMTS